MLFGDEKRFKRNYSASKQDKQIHAATAPAADEMVGPGSYFSTNLDEQRNGWAKKSFSRRQPMTPPASQRHSVFGRNDSFTTGVLTSYGALSAPMSPRDVLNSPGPGYYDRNVFPVGSPRLSPNGRSLSNSRLSPRISSGNSIGGLSQQSAAMSTSKRFLFDQSATLKNGVLFLSAENNSKETGPGYYNYNTDTLNKPSHNVRAKSRSPTPKAAGGSSGFNTPRGGGSTTGSINGRPRSASSGRLRNF